MPSSGVTVGCVGTQAGHLRGLVISVGLEGGRENRSSTDEGSGQEAIYPRPLLLLPLLLVVAGGEVEDRWAVLQEGVGAKASRSKRDDATTPP